MIAFSGIDGAGKSTQINLLRVNLESKGHKVLVFWSRGGYTPGMLLLKKFLGISGNSSQNSKHQIKRNKLLTNNLTARIWLHLAIIDLITYYSLYFRIKELFGFSVICDRHIYDTEIDFRLNFPKVKFYDWWLWRLLILSSKRPVKHFISTIPVDESTRRSRLKNEPFPDSRVNLSRRLAIYKEYADKESHIIHLDGMQSIQHLHSKILSELNMCEK